MPRVGVTRERIVAAAAAITDERGLEHLTLADVARRLGVTLPSLYKHVDGLEAVKHELTLLGLRQLTAAVAAAAVGRARGEALHAIAGAYRAYARAHPGLCSASVRAPEPGDAEHVEAAAAAIDVLEAALSGYRIDGDDAVDAIRALRAAMHGFATLEASRGFGLPPSLDASYARLIDALDAAFSGWSQT